MARVRTEATPSAAPPPAWRERVGRARLFQGLSADELAVVTRAAQPRRVAKRAFFFHQGDPASALYVLVEGQVRVTQTTPEGHQVVLRIVGPGEMFGGIAVLGDAVYPASAQAVSGAEALAWSAETVAQLLGRYPKIAGSALRLLARRIQEIQDRYRELATERVERRVARAVLRLARQVGRKVPQGVLLDMALSRQDLAELTGTTFFTVSRIVSQWQQQGLVEAGRSRLVILRPHDLVSVAEDLPVTPTPSPRP